MPMVLRVLSGWNPERRELLGVLAIGLALAIWFTGPALFASTPRLLGAPDSEVYSNVWVLWWGQQTLLETWAVPIWADTINAPSGRGVHCLPLMDALLTLPLHGWLSASAVYHLVVFGHVVFAAVSAAWFLRRFGAGPWLALPGVIAFTTTSTFVGAMASGPIESLGIGWMPFTMVLVLEALSRGGRLRVAAAAVALGGCFLANPYYFVFTAVNLAWMSLLELRGWPSRGWLLRAVVIGVGAIVIMVPQIMAIEMTPGLSPRDGDLALETQLRMSTLSHDVLGLLLPVDGFNRDVVQRRIYVGLSVVGLALAGVRRSGSRRWWVFAVVGCIYALGALPRLGGQSLGLSPFALTLNRLPVLENISHPFRMLPLVVLALGVLGAKALERLPPERRRTGAIGAAVVIGLDLLVVSPARGLLPTTSAESPAFYHQLGEELDPASVVVLDMVDGVTPNPSRALIHQAVHQQKLLVDIMPPDRPWADNGMVQLAQWRADQPLPFVVERMCADALSLSQIDVRYIVCHRSESSNPRWSVLAACGFPVVSATEAAVVVEIPRRESR